MGLGEMLGTVLGKMRDVSIVFSYDRTGFEAHKKQFDPQDLAVDMHGKVCVVTGANSGIGLATCRALAHKGARVIMACRNRDRGEAARKQIGQETQNPHVSVELVDLSEKQSICAFVDRLSANRVDVLVHNAGVLPKNRKRNSEGLELTLATNLIGPFLLTHLLLEKLDPKTAKKEKEEKNAPAGPAGKDKRVTDPARVVFVSSGGMYAQKLNLKKLVSQSGRFDGTIAYAQTKRALVIINEIYAQRYDGLNISFFAMHPGWADTPSVRRSLPRFWKLTRKILRTPEQAADTVVWLAVCPRIAMQSGRFWFDRKPRRTHYVYETMESAEAREKLWDLCEKLAGLENKNPTHS